MPGGRPGQTVHVSDEPGRRAARERRRAREELIADRAQAARTRALRRVGLRAPATLPAPTQPPPR